VVKVRSLTLAVLGRKAGRASYVGTIRWGRLILSDER
jgi:hypothetical protein